MTDKEIIKALESLLDKMRAYESQQASIGKGLVEDIISMHDRQKAEIEKLNKEVDRLSQVIMYHDGQVADAIKEFAERFRALFAEYSSYDTLHVYEILDRIDVVEEEMVGDAK